MPMKGIDPPLFTILVVKRFTSKMLLYKRGLKVGPKYNQLKLLAVRTVLCPLFSVTATLLAPTRYLALMDAPSTVERMVAEVKAPPLQTRSTTKPPRALIPLIVPLDRLEGRAGRM